jgi:hypothetical protein
MMSDKAEVALAATLSRLRASTALTEGQAEAVAREFAAEYQSVEAAEPGSWVRSSVLSEVGGYIGTVFVVAAAAALVTPKWDDLSEAFRVSVLGGPGLLLAIFAIVLAVTTPGGWQINPVEHGGPRRRLVSVLLVSGGVLVASAASVTSPDNAERIVPLVLFAISGGGYLFCRGVLLHLGTGFALAWSILALSNPSFEANGVVPGGVLILAGGAWAALTLFDLVVEKDLGIAVAGAMAFIGAEMIIVDYRAWLGYLLMTGLAVLGLGGYIRTQRLSALAVGAVSLAVVAPQALIDYTGDSLGTSGALLVCGLSIVAASALSMRLRKSVAEAMPPSVLS